MKIKNVYEQICSFDNLHQAYLNARKCKRYRDEVLEFTNNLENNLFRMSKELQSHTYNVGNYREFYIFEPKKRLIMALPFYDRVVQWAIYQIVNPMFVKGYIQDSYACIKDRGSHEAVKRLHYWLRQIGNKQAKYYYLKLDIAKYFYRIDHQVLLDILRRKIKDKDLMQLFETIINSKTRFGLELNTIDPEQSNRVEYCGMPIGNLTSQMFANVYLNELDQYCKRQLSIHYYIRYMDDVIILSDDKKKLHEYKTLIDKFLQQNLKLNLNNKTAIRPVNLGVEFVGYKLWNTHIKLRKSTALKMKRRLRQVRIQYENGKINLDKVSCTVASYNGILAHCNSHRLTNKIYNNYVLTRKNK